MKVLIANPPAYIQNYKRHFVQAGSRWSFSMRIPKDENCKDHYLPYPFFLAYSSALLKRKGDVEVKAVDGCALDFDETAFTDYIKSFKPDILVMEVPTISFPLVMEITRRLKEDMDFNVVITGTHVTALAKEVMREYSHIDYCLLGEYELPLNELVEHLASGHGRNNVRNLKGLAFHHQGNIIVNEKRNLLMDLDSLPLPDRKDFRIEHYHDFEIAGKPSAQMLTSRGCPSNCIFCLERQVFWNSPLYRRRNPEKVVNEMILVKENGAKQVYFDDETMVIDRRHVRAICKEIINTGLDIPWTCMGDITLDYDTLNLMAKTGCVGVKFGVETANTKTIVDIKKTFMNPENVKRFVEYCKKLDVWSHATYIIGLPGERKEDILKTLDFAIKLNSDSAQFSIATPFPGTPFFEMAKENGWLATYDWTMYDGANYAIVNYPWLTKEEIEHLYRMALKRYYKDATIKSITNPRKAIRLIKAGSFTYAMRKATQALMGGSTL